jgi:uncharacterized protein (TIGR04255 family)
MSNKHAKPPITEAVIEFRFSPSISEKALRRLVKSASLRYTRTEEQIEVEFKFEPKAVAQDLKQQFAGARFFSSDGADLLILTKGSLSVSRLAPYLGWDALRTRLEVEMAEFRREAADRRFTRVGVRYINRIDVPDEDGIFSPEPYITLFPARPEVLANAAAQSFAVSVAGCVVDGYNINVNTGTAPPQLIAHGALMVDVDTFVDGDMDARQAMETLDGARTIKNAVFESLITDEARKLFS